MANFIGLVYATLKNEGIDTKGMDTDEAIKKYNELKSNDGGKNAQDEATPAEQERLEDLGIKTKFKEFSQIRSKLLEDGSLEIDEEEFDRNLKERDEFFKNSFNVMNEKLGKDGEERLNKSIDFYSKGFDADINGLLRGEDLQLDKNRINLVESAVEGLQNAIKEFEIPENIKLYRNISISALKDLGINENNINELIGMTYNEKGFSSTSIDKDVAIMFRNEREKETKQQQILFEINVSKGKNKGLPIYNKSNFKEEQEVLLKNNSNFRITNVTKKDNGEIYIEGEML
jgi:hypothetical protein